MKRTLLALAFGIGIFFTIYGVAAAVGVKAQTLGVGNIDTQYRNKQIRVTLSGASGTLGQLTGTTPAAGFAESFTFPAVDASVVTSVNVTLAG